VILIADVLFIIGALTQASSYTVPSMVIGRSIVGAAVGTASFVTPLYIAELSPAAYRGRLVTMNVLSITLGQVVAYLIGWGFAEHGDPETGWRWLVGLGAVPAALQCVLLFVMPETPRWLVQARQSAAARRVIEKTLGSDPDSLRLVSSILKDIEIEVRDEEDSARSAGQGKTSRWLKGWWELLTVPKNRRALIIACLLQGLQQLCGFVSGLSRWMRLVLQWLTTTELTDVLFCDYIHNPWVFDTNAYITERRSYQLHLYRHGTFLD
jgi:MFS transporter, SP family, solute carrier family 2 (myo-inositol transporter), member 13